MLKNWIPNTNPLLFTGPDGVGYSTPLSKFEPALIGLFDKAIGSTQHVPQLERYVLEELFWRETALLESVGANEPYVCQLREKIT